MKTKKLEEILKDQKMEKVFDEFFFKKQIVNMIAVETEYRKADIETVLQWVEDVLKDYKEEIENEK